METHLEGVNETPKNERIRYSFEKGHKKNTLSTVRVGDFIIFGISRCNTKDTFKKDIGKKIATARRDLMVEDLESEPQLSVNEYSFHQSGLRGVCHLSRVKELLNFFDNMNEFVLVEPTTAELINKVKEQNNELTHD